VIPQKQIAGGLGAPVHGSVVTDGAGNVVAEPGAVGIAGVALVVVEGFNCIQVTFEMPFANASYVWSALGLQLGAAPGILSTVIQPEFVTPDPRTESTLTFALTKTNPFTQAVTAMVTCQ